MRLGGKHYIVFVDWLLGRGCAYGEIGCTNTGERSSPGFAFEGTILIGLYLGTSTIALGYGAAVGLILLAIWV
jgi:hypothetical protein